MQVLQDSKGKFVPVSELVLVFRSLSGSVFGSLVLSQLQVLLSHLEGKKSLLLTLNPSSLFFWFSRMLKTEWGWASIFFLSCGFAPHPLSICARTVPLIHHVVPPVRCIDQKQLAPVLLLLCCAGYCALSKSFQGCLVPLLN